MNRVRIRFADGVVDLRRAEVRYASGERCALSQREVALLRFLVSHRGRAISRDEILEQVWQVDPRRINTRTVDMHVSLLRAKLHDDGARPQVLLTVHGRGYMLSLKRRPAARAAVENAAIDAV